MKGGIGIKQPKQHLPQWFSAWLLFLLLLFGTSHTVLARELPEVYAGGQSIGVLLQTEGVTVVGFSPPLTEDSLSGNPAVDGGLKIGDFITTVNGVNVNSNQQVAALVAAAGEAGELCRLNYLRDGKLQEIEIEPRFCLDSQSWRIGLYVRDNTAGVGTLTFWDPVSHVYGALGHSVSGLEHGVEGDEIGHIVRASVQGVRMGSAGQPGEKLGVFLEQSWQGTINTNGNYGVYGLIDSLPDGKGALMPVADAEEVTDGPATIYTVLSGETVKSYKVNIHKTKENYSLNGRGMVVEIIDPQLLELTGGIVQGMSGSPIVQNGKLIGAVTHVFVNDPVRGYACYVEQMLTESGLIDNQK